MVNQLQFKMASQPQISGFTLLEMMLVLFVVSSLSVLTLTIKPSSLTMDSLMLFEQTYKMKQLEALSNQKKVVFNHLYQSNVSVLSFNLRGHVNMAQTIQIEDSDFVIQLGAGRYDIR